MTHTIDVYAPGMRRPEKMYHSCTFTDFHSMSSHIKKREPNTNTDYLQCADNNLQLEIRLYISLYFTV